MRRTSTTAPGPRETPPARPTVGAPRTLERADQQAILDNLPALIAYWDADLRNRLANRAYVEYFGMTPEQIFGRHIRDMLGEELYAKNRPYLERALAGERQQFDREIPTPSGPRYTQAQYLPDVRDGQVHGIFVLVTDISARRKAEVALANAEARFRTLFERAPSATLLKDRHGVILDANEAASRFFGYPVAELRGMPTASLIDPEDCALAEQIREQLFGGTIERFSQERGYRHAAGHHVWAQVEAALVLGSDEDHDTPRMLVQIQDITARKNHERELEYLTTHDPLTGVLNRHGITRELESHSHNAHRGGLPGSVLICDMDRFKQVNDSLGHGVGDALLAHVARVIERSIRSTDAVGRLGGDEFAVLLAQEDLNGAEKVAERIRLNLAASQSQQPWASVEVGISIGAAAFTPGGSVDDVLRQADLAMFAAKDPRRGERRGLATASRH